MGLEAGEGPVPDEELSALVTGKSRCSHTLKVAAKRDYLSGSKLHSLILNWHFALTPEALLAVLGVDCSLP